jgi:hypothetical protein
MEKMVLSGSLGLLMSCARDSGSGFAFILLMMAMDGGLKCELKWFFCPKIFI